jgi:hypothetical protein
MKSVSKRVINVAGVATVVALLVVQPVFAAARTSGSGGYFDSLARKIIRLLDTIDIRFPPG